MLLLRKLNEDKWDCNKGNVVVFFWDEVREFVYKTYIMTDFTIDKCYMSRK